MPSTSDGVFPASSNKKVYPVNSSGFSLTYPIVAALSSFPSSPTAFDPNNNLYTFVYVIVVSSSVLSVRTNSYPSISETPSLSGCAPSSFFSSIVFPSAVSCTHFVISFLVTGLFFAFTFASSECVPPFSAIAFTSLPSLTWFAGIVTTPVVGSIFIDGSVPSGNFQTPSSPFVATRVPSWSFSSVYVIWTTSTSLSAGGVTVTDPSSFAFRVGASGLAGVVSVTVTGTLTSTSSPFGNITVTTASVSPAFDTSGSVFTLTSDPFGRFVIFSLYWSTVGCVPTVVSTFPSTLASHAFGFWSSSSLIPSLSSSGSVESGIPSPSVSLNIVIWISFVCSFPAASFAFIVTVTSLSSSVSAQFVSFSGVPSILPVFLL